MTPQSPKYPSISYICLYTNSLWMLAKPPRAFFRTVPLTKTIEKGAATYGNLIFQPLCHSSSAHTPSGFFRQNHKPHAAHLPIYYTSGSLVQGFSASLPTQTNSTVPHPTEESRQTTSKVGAVTESTRIVYSASTQARPLTGTYVLNLVIHRASAKQTEVLFCIVK